MQIDGKKRVAIKMIMEEKEWEEDSLLGSILEKGEKIGVSLLIFRISDDIRARIAEEIKKDDNFLLTDLGISQGKVTGGTRLQLSLAHIDDKTKEGAKPITVERVVSPAELVNPDMFLHVENPEHFKGLPEKTKKIMKFFATILIKK